MTLATACPVPPSPVPCCPSCSMPLDQLQRGGAKRGGSPAFFAPEQFTPCFGLPVDVWAAGVTMYLLLTGRYPFWEAQRAELEHRLPAYQVGWAGGGRGGGRKAEC